MIINRITSPSGATSTTSSTHVVIIGTKNKSKNETARTLGTIARSKFATVYVHTTEPPSTELDRALAKHYTRIVTSHVTTVVMAHKNWPVRYGQGVGDDKYLLPIMYGDMKDEMDGNPTVFEISNLVNCMHDCGYRCEYNSERVEFHMTEMQVDHPYRNIAVSTNKSEHFTETYRKIGNKIKDTFANMKKDENLIDGPDGYYHIPASTIVNMDMIQLENATMVVYRPISMLPDWEMSDTMLKEWYDYMTNTVMKDPTWPKDYIMTQSEYRDRWTFTCTSGSKNKRQAKKLIECMYKHGYMCRCGHAQMTFSVDRKLPEHPSDARDPDMLMNMAIDRGDSLRQWMKDYVMSN